MGLGMEAITRWQLKLHIFPHARILEFLEREQGDMQTPIEWNKSKNLAPPKKNSIIKNNLGHILYCITTYILGFDILDVISHVLMSIELDYVL